MLLAISIVVFLILHLIPGDPARSAAGPDATEEDIDLIRKNYGLDKPLPIQYWIYLKKMLHGDLGRSFRTRRPVIQEISRRLPATADRIASTVRSFGGRTGAVTNPATRSRSTGAGWPAACIGSAPMACYGGRTPAHGTPSIGARGRARTCTTTGASCGCGCIAQGSTCLTISLRASTSCMCTTQAEVDGVGVIPFPSR